MESEALKLAMRMAKKEVVLPSHLQEEVLKPNFECPFITGTVYKVLYDDLLFLNVIQNEIVLVVDVIPRVYDEYFVRLLHDNKVKNFVYHKHIPHFNNFEKYFEKVVDKQK